MIDGGKHREELEAAELALELTELADYLALLATASLYVSFHLHMFSGEYRSTEAVVMRNRLIVAQ